MSRTISGTLDDHVTLAAAGVFVGFAIGFILAGIVGVTPIRSVVVAVAATLVVIPAWQLSTFGSISVSKDARVELCHDKYWTTAGHSRNFPSRFDIEGVYGGWFIEHECAKYRNALSASGTLPHRISDASIKAYARHGISYEKCYYKYVGIRLTSHTGKRLPIRFDHLDNAGLLYSDGTIKDYVAAQRVLERAQNDNP